MIKLRVGKWYQTRNGNEVIKITSTVEGELYYNDTNSTCDTWYENGRYSKNRKMVCDLVREVRIVPVKRKARK